MKLHRTFTYKLNQFASELATLFLGERPQLPQEVDFGKLADLPEFTKLQDAMTKRKTPLTVSEAVAVSAAYIRSQFNEQDDEKKQTETPELVSTIEAGKQQIFLRLYKGFMKIPPVDDDAKTNLRRMVLWTDAVRLCDEYSSVPLATFCEWITPIEDPVFQKSYKGCKDSEFFRRLGTELYWKQLDKDEKEAFWSSIIQMVQHKGMFLTCGSSLGDLEAATQEFMAGQNGNTDISSLGDKLFQQILQGGKLSQTIQKTFMGNGGMTQMAQNLLGTAMRAPGSEKPDLSALTKILENPELKQAIDNNEIDKHMEEARKHMKGMSIQELQQKALEEVAKQNTQSAESTDDDAHITEEAMKLLGGTNFECLLGSLGGQQKATVPEKKDDPTEASAEASAETPAEVHAEVPAEVPVEVPVEVPAEAPAEAPAEVPTETSDEVSAEAPAEAPTEAPAEAPVTKA